LSYFRSSTAITNDPLGYQQSANALFVDLGFNQLNKNWKQLIIIPDGKTSFIPFDALITSSEFAIDLSKANYLLKRYNCIYGYSAQILLQQATNNIFDASNISVFAPAFRMNEREQRPLLHSLEEAEAIGQTKDAHLFENGKATIRNFREQFDRTGIMHIATHAYADTATNNDPRIEFIDSSLALSELYATHTHTSLVVLSACETGIGKLNTSEGPMSLARGFYYAGTKNVITSYWNVDDQSTATLFKYFYKKINGSTSSSALYEAKKSFIENATGTTASPYYWAGFVHFGKPGIKEQKSQWWWLLVLPLLVVVIYFFKRAKPMENI